MHSCLNRRLLVGLSILAAALAGCDDAGDAEPRAATVRDSAGVMIVESPAALADRLLGWALSAEPEVRIGVVEGDPDYQLSLVTGAASLPDGRIAVVNGGTQEVRFFSPAGEFLQSVGRQGRGPGEFQFPQLLPAPSYDSLLIADFLANRFTFIGSDGGFGRFITPAWPPAEPLGWLGGGSVLMQRSGATATPDTPEGLITNEITFLTASLDGGSTGTVAQLPGPRIWVWKTPRQIIFTSVPFDGVPSAAVGADEIYIAPGGPPEVRVYGEDGALRRVLRIERASEPLARSEWDDLVEAQVADEDTPGEQAALRGRYARMPMPDQKPAFRRVLVDAAGQAREEHFRADTLAAAGWTVFDRGGTALGTVQTPAGLVVQQIGRDFVLGRARDELDIEYVVRYRLAPS